MAASLTWQVQLQPLGWGNTQLSVTQLSGWTVEVTQPAVRTEGGNSSVPSTISELSDTTQFPVRLTRRSARMVSTIFMPATFINVIGLSTFWLEGYVDSVLVGPLAFLALMTLHASDMTKVDADELTYFDTFYLLSASVAHFA